MDGTDGRDGRTDDQSWTLQGAAHGTRARRARTQAAAAQCRARRRNASNGRAASPYGACERARVHVHVERVESTDMRSAQILSQDEWSTRPRAPLRGPNRRPGGLQSLDGEGAGA